MLNTSDAYSSSKTQKPFCLCFWVERWLFPCLIAIPSPGTHTEMHITWPGTFIAMFPKKYIFIFIFTHTRKMSSIVTNSDRTLMFENVGNSAGFASERPERGNMYTIDGLGFRTGLLWVHYDSSFVDCDGACFVLRGTVETILLNFSSGIREVHARTGNFVRRISRDSVFKVSVMSTFFHSYNTVGYELIYTNRSQIAFSAQTNMIAVSLFSCGIAALVIAYETGAMIRMIPNKRSFGLGATSIAFTADGMHLIMANLGRCVEGTYLHAGSLLKLSLNGEHVAEELAMPASCMPRDVLVLEDGTIAVGCFPAVNIESLHEKSHVVVYVDGDFTGCRLKCSTLSSASGLACSGSGGVLVKYRGEDSLRVIAAEWTFLRRAFIMACLYNSVL